MGGENLYKKERPPKPLFNYSLIKSKAVALIGFNHLVKACDNCVLDFCKLGSVVGGVCIYKSTENLTDIAAEREVVSKYEVCCGGFVDKVDNLRGIVVTGVSDL